MIGVLRAEERDGDRTHAMSPRLLEDILGACTVYNPRYVYAYTLCNDSVAVGIVFSVVYSLTDVVDLNPSMLAIVSSDSSRISNIPVGQHILYASLESGLVYVVYECMVPSQCSEMLHEYLEKLGCNNSELEYYVVADQLEEIPELVSSRHWRGRNSD